MDKKFIPISADLYCTLKKKITDLEIERDKLLDDKLLAQARIHELKEQVAKLTRIVDAIV